MRRGSGFAARAAGGRTSGLQCNPSRARVEGAGAAAGSWNRPGSVLRLVRTHNWQSDQERLLARDLVTLSRGAAMKISYSHRF